MRLRLSLWLGPFTAAVSLSVVVLCTPMESRAEESLSQTTAWLSQNLPSLAFADDGFENVTHQVTYSFDRCDVGIIDRGSHVESTKAANTRYYAITFTPMPGTSLYSKPAIGTKFEPAAATQSIQTFGLEEHTTISLRDIDLSSLRVRAYAIDGSQPQTSAAATMVFGSREVDIGTTDSDLANRALKALRHAAKLCGAKSSGF